MMQPCAVTILRTNLTGWSAFCERVGNRAAAAALNEHLNRIVPIIKAHGGIIHQFTGDGIEAYFGVPTPDPDHAANAVFAGIEMLRAQASQPLQLPLRIGIASGEATFGAIGAAAARELRVFGPCVQEAARMMELARGNEGQVVITPATAARAGKAAALPLLRVAELQT